MTTTAQQTHGTEASPRGVPVGALVTVTLGVTLLGAHLWGGLEADEFSSRTNGASEIVNVLLDWRNYVPIAAILLLEWWAPVVPYDRRRHRAATIHDGLWTAAHILLWAPLIVVVLRGGDWLFDGPLSGLRLDLSGTLPNLVLLGLGFLLGELVRWWVHYTFHRVPALWRFHAVHHVQADLRLWTDFRVHPLEAMLREVAVALPFYVLGGQYSSLVGVLGFAYVWLTPLHHANVRTNLGPLRWVLVTPQSHRVHHSTDPAHYDTNFGNVLCIWDRLFGTQAPDDRVYPTCGVDGYDVSDEASTAPGAVVNSYVERLAEPFRRSA